ncbi:hypothetical protein [Pseudoalteromonas sp. P1-11]|uniref:hypothetical protein n=1 Tax=Pseudoalteromonas sp. P1-11 TaxID=1715254 RepID=UPI0006DC0D56|nr:hypothetical protein [Pseudoalteromonas sp. P1-11]KPW03193.1 hypothetical protein AN390_01268 [Pseudoalteromonas sp. P1-11]
MDIVSTVNNSLKLVKRLKEISKNISDAEFSNLLADLSIELADVKLESASLKEELASLKDEVRILKSTTPAPDEKPTGTKWGFYQFVDDSGLYCTACWDSKRNKSMTNRVNARFRSCPVCKTVIGS